MLMLHFLCVLRSGGIYTAEWVRKLRAGVARHFPHDHVFDCLSDVPVPCNRIPLIHKWPGWWSKVEIFRPGVVVSPTVFLDLDTVIVGDLSPLQALDKDYALLDLRGTGWAQLGAMFLKKPPVAVYERFAADPEALMAFYKRHERGQYVGDQALWKDVVGHDNVPKLTDLLPGFFRSYKLHCRDGVPAGTSVVCFHGKPRPSEVSEPWMKAAWA